MIKPSRHIQDASDFEDEALEILESFITELIEEGGWTRPLEEDDGFDPDEVGDDFVVYTDKAQRLIDKLISRLYKIGNKHFPNEEIHLETSMYQFP